MTVELEPYCLTEHQRIVLRTVGELGTHRKAAAELGLDRRSVDRTMHAIKVRAAMAGIAPEAGLTRPIAAGQELRGYSVLTRNAFDEPVWVKTRASDDAIIAAIQTTVDALKEDIDRYAPVPAPAHTPNDLMNVFLLTDYHLGMLSWPEETGQTWDLVQAETLLHSWFGRAIEQAPPADRAVLAQIGDFMHWDGMDPVTPTNRHVLDADSRFPKLVRTAIRLLRGTIDRLLHKYPEVHVIMAEGNHDLASSVWLRELLADAYADERRVTIDTTPSPYYAVEFGDTSIFFHHGHLRRGEKISEVFAAKFRELWGRTRHSYAYTGHLHHDRLDETGLMTVEQLRTLASPDAYAARNGYMSGRDAKVDTFHKVSGRVGRAYISPEMCM